MPHLTLSTSLTSKANVFYLRSAKQKEFLAKDTLGKKLSLTKTRHHHINIKENVEHHNLVLLQRVLLTRFTLGGVADIFIFYSNQKLCPKPVLVTVKYYSFLICSEQLFIHLCLQKYNITKITRLSAKFIELMQPQTHMQNVYCMFMIYNA